MIVLPAPQPPDDHFDFTASGVRVVIGLVLVALAAWGIYELGMVVQSLPKGH